LDDYWLFAASSLWGVINISASVLSIIGASKVESDGKTCTTHAVPHAGAR
jgi:hypothetical protein